jgi:hypothetical protein
MPPDSIPEGYRCIACGYDAGGLPGYVCSECAEPVTGEAIVAWRARRRWQEQWGRLLGQRVAAGALICVIYSAGAGAVVRNLEAAWIALLGLGMVVGASLLAGLLCAATAPHGCRQVASAIWLKRLWALHLPWLVVGPGAVVVAVAVSAERTMGVDAGTLVTAVWLPGFMCWLVLIVMSPVIWLHQAQDDFVQARLLTRPVWALMVVSALAIAVAAAAMGSVGGAVALMAPMDVW